MKARLMTAPDVLKIAYEQMTAPQYFGNGAARRAQTRILAERALLFDRGGLELAVSCVLPLEDAATAHRMVEAGHTSGRVVLQLD